MPHGTLATRLKPPGCFSSCKPSALIGGGGLADGRSLSTSSAPMSHACSGDTTPGLAEPALWQLRGVRGPLSHRTLETCCGGSCRTGLISGRHGIRTRRTVRPTYSSPGRCRLGRRRSTSCRSGCATAVPDRAARDGQSRRLRGSPTAAPGVRSPGRTGCQIAILVKLCFPNRNADGPGR